MVTSLDLNLFSDGTLLSLRLSGAAELGTVPIIGFKFLEARSKCNLGLGLSLALLVFFGYGFTLVVRLHIGGVCLLWDPVPVGVISVRCNRCSSTFEDSPLLSPCALAKGIDHP